MTDHTVNQNLFNIKLLILNKLNSKTLRPIVNLNIFESSTQNFDPNGLFSTEIFGQVGSDLRNSGFAYIELNTKVLHPLIFKHLGELKAFYKDIMSGKKFATFNKKLGDFVLSTPTEGSTGYTFFVNHLEFLKLQDNGSDVREIRVKMVNAYSGVDSRISRWLVLPAGLRDYYVDENGTPKEDEVNDLYRKLMTTCNVLGNVEVTPSTEHTIDSVRYRIQLLTMEIYEHFRVLLDGKNKFIQGKWGKRAVSNGTRNVITPAMPNIMDLEDTDIPTLNHTSVGLYQFIRAIAPITMNKLHTMFIGRIFNPNTTSTLLVNPKTMKSVLVDVPIKERDSWLSPEGLDGIIGTLKQDVVKAEAVMVAGNYMLLVHDHKGVITLVRNTQDLPEGLDPKFLRPITYYELMHLAIYDVRSKYPGFLTRYPVINLGGIYPTLTYVRTTERPRTITYVDGLQTRAMKEYPNFKEKFVNSLSPANSHLPALGGDYDGDKCSLTVMYTEESIREIYDLFDTKEYYVTPGGGTTYSPVSDTLEYIVKTMAGNTNGYS